MSTRSADQPEPVDVVIAWVDGNDPEHRKRRLAYSNPSATVHDEAVGDIRFAQQGEVYIAIASVLKYMPFVRTIWILTDKQKPRHIDRFTQDGLCAPDKIRIVDHTDILGDIADALPTFNSLSLEAALWRLPGLSNRYIYMNDDFMCLKPLVTDDFFDGSRPLVRGHLEKPSHKKPKIRLRRFLRRITGRGPNTRPSFLLSQEEGARRAGHTDQFVRIGHWPHPMQRDVQRAYYEANWDVFLKQVSFRFRDSEQFNPVSLMNHLVTPDAPLPAPSLAYLRPKKPSSLNPEIDKLLSGTCAFGCLQSIERYPPDAQQRLLRGLADQLGPFLPIDLTAGAVS